MSETRSAEPTDGPAEAAALPTGPAGVLVRNVATNWLWFTLVMASGLIVPRFIAHHQGRALLGVWDLGWSMTFYVGLFSLGLTSAVTRFVAHHRARQDWEGLNASVNTALAVMLAGSALGVLFSFVLAALTPWVMKDARPDMIPEASRVILILSIASALQFPGTVFGGVIGGHERYDLLNLVRGSFDALLLVAMIILLVRGYGLPALAWAVLLFEIPSCLARVWMARRLCPWLHLAGRHCRWSAAREMILFSGKASAQAVATSALYQFNGILVSGFLGPAALAVYSRQRVLVFQSMRFIRQYAQVFIPSSSVLHAVGDVPALRRMLVNTSRYGMYFTVPVVILLVVMGRPLVDLWMRPGYAAPAILALMAIGHLLPVSQQGVYMVLMGMGRHGMPAIFDAAGALVSVVLAVALMAAGLGMAGAALAMAVPVALMGGLVMPAYACRLLKQDFAEYLKAVTFLPLLVNVPFAACLCAARYWFPGAPVRGLLLGMALGGLVNGGIYWQWVLPPELRTRLLRRCGMAVCGPRNTRRAAAAGEAIKA